jgi:predicted signal transduction protein with EAL and GGDEF domain
MRLAARSRRPKKCGRWIEAASAPFDLEGHQVVIGVSIGIAVAPTDAAMLINF